MFPWKGLSELNRIKNGKPTFVPFRLIVVFVLLTAMPHVTQADVFSCSAGDVDCLNAAIEDAHRTSGADSINLEAGTYSLNRPYFISFGDEGLQPIAVEISIVGQPGETPTVIERATGTPKFRVLTVSNTGKLTLQNLVIKGGNVNGDGGGISNNGILNLVRTTVSNNTASGDGGGVWNRKTLSINHSFLSNNVAAGAGGGVHNAREFSELEVHHSTIENNQAQWGGGIGNKFVGFLSGGTLTVTHSTIHNNSASSDGGGIWNTGYMKVLNATVSQNTSSGGGGGIFNGLAVPPIAGQPGIDSIINSTITGNQAVFGGGLTSLGAVELQNTILAGNNANEGPDCTQPLFTSLGHNLIGNTKDCPATFQPTDLFGDPQFVDDDNNGEPDFMDDGRPGKGHFALAATSDAIDKGNFMVCFKNDDAFHALDQLGFPRGPNLTGADLACDIGAFEFQPNTNKYRFVVLADSRDDSWRWRPLTDEKGVNEIHFAKIMESISQLRPLPTFLLMGGDLS